MLRFSKKGVSVLVVLDRRRMKVNGRYPVKVEVVCRRRQKYYATGVDMTEENWQKMPVRRGRREDVAEIEDCFVRVRNEVATMLDSGSFSFRILDFRFRKGPSFNVNQALQGMMDRCMKEGRINSFYRCRSTLRNLEKFAGDEIPFSSITAEWLERCESSWRHDGKNGTTVSIYMRTLKYIMNEAKKEGYVKECPFGRDGGYTIPKGAVRKLALTKSQIKKVMGYHGPLSLEMYRDLWLFSYLCNGINFRDMLFLRYGNVVDGEIRFVRSKTEHAYAGRKVICAVMSPMMQDIIGRWGNPYNGDLDAYIFRFADGEYDEFRAAMLVRKVVSRCNAALKKIAGQLGIPVFTTYSARHSFATVMQRSGAEVSFISECLGHSSLSVTENYLAGFDHEERVRKSALLTDF